MGQLLQSKFLLVEGYQGKPLVSLIRFIVKSLKTTGPSKSPNDYMREWLPLASQKPKLRPPEACHNCQDLPVTYRCLACTSKKYLCWTCCGRLHEHHPMHRVERWTGTHWEPTWLWRLGVSVQLGHCGRRCPRAPTCHHLPAPPLLPALNDTSYGASPEGRRLNRSPVLVVVHTNGVHHLPFVKCNCMGSDEFHIQLLRAGFYPATSSETRTVFTFELLDLYHIETLACHTAANSFYGKLRRLTNETFPSSVPLLRVGRQWRHMKELASFGFANTGKTPGEGDLALLCPACPQPGINLPPDWSSDPQQWVYTRVNVMDRNFVCIHRMLKSQEGDMVWLKGKGEGYMTSKEPYDNYIDSTIEEKEVSKCYNYRAIADRGKAYKGCDASGIGAAACGRHGAFVPTSVLDFQKGERQMNMDYCWSKSVSYGRMKDAPHLLYLYDINCQYPVKLKARLDRYTSLASSSLLDKVTWGIGTWHVHGHKEECLARFSPSFIPGAGRVGGEILESLWSTTNDAGRTTSIMTRPHRSEVLDATLLDSNTQKMQNTELDEAQADYDHINKSASPEQQGEWPKILEDALARRKVDVKAMDIFNLNQHIRYLHGSVQQNPAGPGGQAGGVPKWLSLGIDIQQLHGHTLPLLNIDDLVFVRPPTSDCHCDGGICQHSSSNGDGTPPELLDIAMPSTVRKLPSVWKTLPQRELELRIAQAYESLHKIRVEVGHKSFLFRSNIRLAREKKERLRGYAGVRSANRVINLFRGHYDIARWSIIRLKAPASITSKLKVLLPHHVRALPAIYDHKVRGERNKPAPWIWGIDVAGDAMEEPYLEELHRVNWLRARTRLDRWQEEHTLIQREMGWTEAYFEYQAKSTEAWAEGGQQTPSQVAWAARRAAMWRLMGVNASETFQAAWEAQPNAEDTFSELPENTSAEDPALEDEWIPTGEHIDTQASSNENTSNEASGSQLSDEKTSNDGGSDTDTSDSQASEVDTSHNQVSESKVSGGKVSGSEVSDDDISDPRLVTHPSGNIYHLDIYSEEWLPAHATSELEELPPESDFDWGQDD
ncbi:hypothetical protein FA13DRAFT_1757635 [Coprinellus micaceus]|uniref:CxC2-like cysteine cluster KDZ transposase-associated domain-containing protein n=1 Tax=Coprinellus micaceus TaxID=71717 RepID=A0A4Y7SHD4_COPMI|nr:hypothetical protein FA13DRAFT_1757635 [Coprinellus micaceus]